MIIFLRCFSFYFLKTMKKYLFFTCMVVFCLFFCCGCGVGTNGTEKSWQYGTKSLSATTLFPDSLILRAENFNIHKDIIVLSERSNPQLFAVFQIQENDSLKKTGSFVNSGRGPHEVTAGRGYWIQENNLYAICSYNPHGKIFLIPSEEIKDLSSPNRWTVYENQELFSAINILPLDSVTLLIQKGDANNDKMFALLDLPSGQMKDLEIRFPEDDVQATWRDKAIHIYNGRFGKRPYHDQFLYSSTYGQIVTIYRMENEHIVEEIPIYNELPRYSAAGNGIRRENTNKWGYHPVVTSEYIYLGDLKMMDGDVENAKEKNGFALGDTNEIQVFNWIGEPIIKFELEKAVSFYAVDEENKYLYGFASDPVSFEHYFVRYKLDMDKLID